MTGLTLQVSPVNVYGIFQSAFLKMARFIMGLD